MDDLRSGSIRRLWNKYLWAALGSAVVCSIYATVDLIIVGQYEGPDGAAAMAVVAPLWSIVMSIGILFAVGGSVMYGVSRGAEKGDENEYFSATLLGSLAVSALLVILCRCFRLPLFRLFGADEALMPIVLAYADWLTWFLPFFLVGQVLIFFLRNDGAPMLATAAVVACGVTNIIGDYLLVFTCDMGAEGAGLATVLCQVLAVLVMCSHFFRKRCRLRFVRPRRFFRLVAQAIRAGLSPFIVDFSITISTVLFNNQIMRYAGANELAVYGSAANFNLFIQSILYGVGGALQPIASTNLGAKLYDRIRHILRLALLSGMALSAAFCLVAELFPVFILRLYMDVTPEILVDGPRILRTLAGGIFFLGLNITASYYLQSVLRTGYALTVSLMRGVIVCVPLLFGLPLLFGFDAIWWTIPISEAVTAAVAALLIFKTNKGFDRLPPPETDAA